MQITPAIGQMTDDGRFKVGFLRSIERCAFDLSIVDRMKEPLSFASRLSLNL